MEILTPKMQLRGGVAGALKLSPQIALMSQ